LAAGQLVLCREPNLDDYVEGDDPASLDEMHEELARHNRSDWEGNAERLGRLFSFFRLAALLLVLQVGSWLIAIGSEDHDAAQDFRHPSPKSEFPRNQK